MSTDRCQAETRNFLDRYIERVEGESGDRGCKRDGIMAAIDPILSMGARGGIAVLENDKSRLRYDPEEDVSRHAVTEKERCQQIEKRYSWKLKRIESLNDIFFNFDCVYEGTTEFPKSYYEMEEE